MSGDKRITTVTCHETMSGLEELDRLLRSGDEDALVSLVESSRAEFTQLDPHVVKSLLMERARQGLTGFTAALSGLGHGLQPFSEQLVRVLIRARDEVSLINVFKANPEEAHRFDCISGATWLHRAAEYGLKDFAAFCIEQGYDVNLVAKYGMGSNPLVYAVTSGNIELVTLLLEAGCEPDMRYDGVNPLFVAIKHGHNDIALLLIERGVDVAVVYGDWPINARQLATELKRDAIVGVLGGPEKRSPQVAARLPDFTGVPMNEDKIRAIEQTLNVPFPGHLREFYLEEFPAALFHPEMKDNDDWVPGLDSRLFHTAMSFLVYNLKRSFDPEDKRPQLSDHLIVSTDGGDAECVKLAPSDRSVYYWCHESDEFTKLADTIQDHVATKVDWDDAETYYLDW